ncbi:LOG family protein [uncultured Senegalimassilia sp.]|uniref:LOG family protein n=1 Tax=uncultured Senegalimassilia sp. TaxID=1714350 RepID=UPI0034589491
MRPERAGRDHAPHHRQHGNLGHRLPGDRPRAIAASRTPLHQRKRRINAMPRAMPGDTGTLEEVSEIISLISLAQLDAPCILFNLNGFYDDLRALLNRMSDMGLSSPRRQRDIHFTSSLDEVADILAPLH